MGDVNAQIMGLLPVLRSPHLPQQLAMSYQAPVMLGEHPYELELDRRQVDLDPGASYPPVVEVDDQLP